MSEPIEITALKQCYVILGQYSINQLVMFIVLMLAFLIIIWLAVSLAKQKAIFSQKEDVYKEKILGLIENAGKVKEEKIPGKEKASKKH